MSRFFGNDICALAGQTIKRRIQHWSSRDANTACNIGDALVVNSMVTNSRDNGIVQSTLLEPTVTESEEPLSVSVQKFDDVPSNLVLFQKKPVINFLLLKEWVQNIAIDADNARRDLDQA
eukprot:scaffold3450_cov114-Cylindrotheca_fusiformis.AAC.29